MKRSLLKSMGVLLLVVLSTVTLSGCASTKPSLDMVGVWAMYKDPGAPGWQSIFPKSPETDAADYFGMRINKDGSAELVLINGGPDSTMTITTDYQTGFTVKITRGKDDTTFELAKGGKTVVLDDGTPFKGPIKSRVVNPNHPEKDSFNVAFSNGVYGFFRDLG